MVATCMVSAKERSDLEVRMEEISGNEIHY